MLFVDLSCSRLNVSAVAYDMLGFAYGMNHIVGDAGRGTKRMSWSLVRITDVTYKGGNSLSHARPRKAKGGKTS